MTWPKYSTGAYCDPVRVPFGAERPWYTRVTLSGGPGRTAREARLRHKSLVANGSDFIVRWGEFRSLRLVSFVAAAGLAIVLAAASCGGSAGDKEAEAVREYQQGLSLQERGNLVGAGNAYNRALWLDPRLATSLAGRAYVFYAHGNLPQALENLAVATRLDPELALAYNYRGLVYTAMKDLASAILNYSKAIELQSGYSEAHYNRASASLIRDDIAAAIDDMSVVISLKPDDPGNFMKRADLHVLADDPASASLDLERVLALSQDDAWVLPAKQLLAEIHQAGTP